MTDCIRPWCCPEPRCTPIHNGGVSEEPTPGVSFMCWGYLSEDVRFEYDGQPHKNDLSSCWYTPLKGVIRWQENAVDWWHTAEDYRRALQKLPLTVVARLQPDIRHRILSEATFETGEEDVD